MALKLITAPAGYPVSLAEAKKHLHEESSNQDTLITLFLGAATKHCEKFLGRALIDQTWELTLDEFPTNELKIPLPPLIEIVSVIYINSDGDEVTLTEGTDFTVDNVSEPGWIVPVNGSWPSPFEGINSVRVRFRAGYLDSSSPPVANVDEDIVAAVLMTLGTLYANRETVVIGQTAVVLPFGAEQLLRFRRIDLSMA